MHIYNLLSFRLFLLIAFILTILSIGFSLYFIELETKQYEEVARQCAERTSKIVSGSTRNSMLENHKENTFEIMRSIVNQQGIEKISLYNKKGEIIYSTSEAEIGTKAKMTDRNCLPCHSPSGEIREKPLNRFHNISESDTGHRQLSYVTPILNEQSCFTAACHAHNENETIIGVLFVVMSLDPMDTLVEENKARMITTNVMITLLLALGVGVFLWIWVHVPVKNLIKGTREISSGNLDYKIKATSRDEIGQLANSFNVMTDDLIKAKEEITTWSNELEQRVKQKTEELEKTQKRNLQIEKMASLGQLSATVAHELNNPMAGILTYSKLIQKKLQKDGCTDEEKEVILKHLKMIETESARSGEIIKNMLLFSRQGAIDIKSKDINQVIESAIDLISHHLELHNIQLIKELQKDLPAVEIDENQIKQALLALFVNAVEAMENEGILAITTEWRRPEKQVWVYIRDAGKGIPPDVQAHIFEPFYTTKNAIKGVGLGLSAVYAIIKNHQGDIAVESIVNQGATFIIKLPLNRERSQLS